MALLWPAFGPDLANRSGPPKCHHPTPHVAQIIIPHVPDVGRIWADIMLLSGKGAVARLKEDNPELIAYHCIIHQSVLCASLSDEHAGVMNTMMKIINFLRESSSYQVKSSQLYLYSAFNNTDCVKALNSIKLEDRVSVMYNNKIKHSIFS